MKERRKTWLLATGATALIAFAALIYHLYPGVVARLGVDRDELGGIALAVLILWLVLRRQQPMTQQARLALGVVVAVGLLVGLAVFFIS
jgi:4-amino-4-deoxy-L-arabinose transferase-like glycosyltransferase